ncbi:Protein transport protein Sec61 alpha [Mycena kentingensis (nom. inval.)]|nr:Protein transport protein Sec61 alpha [Mycena kentingensis (nom. inval.)]
MSGFQFLNLVLPFLPILPEVSSSDHKKIPWTAVTFVIFLVRSQVPLHGIMSSDSSDPLYWMRVTVASNRGTLVEPAITPLSPRALFGGAHKLFALIVAIGQGIVYVLTGSTASPASSAPKGYGLGSGISLFIATHICESIVWKAFSSTIVNTSRDPEFDGAIVALFHRLFTWNDRGRALREACWRDRLPNVVNLVATAVIFGAPVPWPTRHVPHQALLLSITLESALAPNVFILSHMLASRYPANLFVKLLAVRELMEDSQQLVATSAIVYYMSPPRAAALDEGGARQPHPHGHLHHLSVLRARALLRDVDRGVGLEK